MAYEEPASGRHYPGCARCLAYEEPASGRHYPGCARCMAYEEPASGRHYAGCARCRTSEEPASGRHYPMPAPRHCYAKACSCTPATARPEGSAMAAKLASHAIAAGDEQAMDFPPGTVSAAAWVGKNCSNTCR